MSLILDISRLTCCQTDGALEFLHKSISDGDGDTTWDEHPSPLVRRLIELFTDRGLTRLQGFQEDLEAWARGDRHERGAVPERPAGAMERWMPGEMKLARLYLERLPAARWTLDDHMMMVDYLVQRYLPADAIKTEAEWLASRAALMGRVQASMADVAEKQADKLVSALPATVAGAEKKFVISAAQRETLRYAVAHAGENIRAFREDTRHALRMIVARHAHDKALDNRGPSLQTDLQDRFAVLNRDWRRIAVTEAGEALNQGYIASLAPGRKVKRVEQYRGACPFCRRLDGAVVTVVSADKKDKDGETEIWVGKDNIGRSAAARKRIGDKLVPRAVDEMWWPPAGLVHPNCRGRWIPLAEPKPGDDADFHDWMMETLNPKK
jgi:hypothetical protein